MAPTSACRPCASAPRASAVSSRSTVRRGSGPEWPSAYLLPVEEEQAMPAAKIILADDQILFRDCIGQLLRTQDDMRVVAEAGDGQQAVNLAMSYCPDLVLMDINMPRLGGLEAPRRIKEALPETKVIMLTVPETDDDLFEAIKAGAERYLLQHLKAARLFQRF